VNDLCDGCQRPEVHKKCPAHGTPFYMSGIPYPKEIEEIMNKMFYSTDKETLFKIVRSVHEILDKKYKLLDKMVQDNQGMGLYE